MTKKIAVTIVILSALALNFSSCYNNKSDITSPDYTVSFSKQVVPIFSSGPCGCHNTVGATNTLGSASAVRFSNGNFNGTDTILYDAILARVSVMEAWVNGGSHPGGGNVFLTSSEASVIKQWIAQGATDDRDAESTVNTATYSKDIAPIVNTTCSASSCHGGVAVALTFSKLTSDASILSSMVTNKGTSGHPGGKLSLSSATWTKFQTWLSNGMPQ